MADFDEATVQRLRERAEEVLSLNLKDLDIEQLELRLDIIRHLEQIRPAGGEADFDCKTFNCGTFS